MKDKSWWDCLFWMGFALVSAYKEKPLFLICAMMGTVVVLVDAVLSNKK